MNWEGNKLTSCGDKTYSYDASGRFANFKYEGDKLINDGRRYMYGVDGLLGFFISGRKYYFYQKNLFGDVVGIKEYDFTTATTTNVAAYVYDAFGNHKVYSVTVDYNGNEHLTENTDPNFIGNYNPIRYRGYYYDIDTGYYFVGGRCYDPEIGRFIDPASISSLANGIINGLNIYSYANNKPINYKHTSNISKTNTNDTRVISAINAQITIRPQSINNIMVPLYILSNIYSEIDKWSGNITNAYDTLYQSDRFKRFSIVMVVAGSVFSWLSSTYNNYTNPNYTKDESLLATGIDAAHYIAKGVATYWVGKLVGTVAIKLGILLAGSLGGILAIGVCVVGALLINKLGDNYDEAHNEYKKLLFE